MPKKYSGTIDDLAPVKTVSGRADDLAAVESSHPPPDVPPPPPVDVPTLWEMVKKQAYESSPAVLFQRENAAPIAAALAAAAAPATGGASAVPAILAALGGAAGEGVGQGYDAIKAGRAVDLPAAGQAMAKEGAIQGVAGGVGELVGKSAQALARPVYQWALRPYAGLRKNFGLDTLIETGLNERIPVTKGGTLKAEQLRNASGAEAQQMIAAADKAGAKPIAVSEINKGLQGVRDTMAEDVRLGSSDERQALDARVKAMEAANPQDISLTDAQALKQRAQARADKAYRAERAGTPVSTSLETEESIASSLRQAIEDRFPQVKGQSQIKTVNERTRGLIGLHRALGDAEGRTSVLGTLLAISGAIGGGGGGLVSGHPLLGATVAAPLAMKLMTSPGVLSHGAIMANELVTPGAVSSILRAFGGKDGFRRWYQQEVAKREGQPQEQPQP